MASIGIIITQSGVSGGAGQSREDLILGIPVVLSNVSGSGVTSYKWEIIGKPYTSVVTLSSSTGATSTFTPDVTGSYLVQLTINGKLKERVVGAILTSRYELRIPAAGEGEEIAGGSFKAITEGIRTLESEGSNASSIQGEPVSTANPGLNDLLRYNGSQWLPSGKVRTDDIGFRNNQDILIKIPLSAAIPANSYWQYDAGTSSAKPCWKTVTSGGVKPVLDFSWNVFPHGSVLKKLCIVAACNNTVSNQLTITVDKTGAVWSANQITSFIEQFLSTTQHTVSSTVSSVLEVSANTTFTHGNGVDVPVASEGLSIRLTADGVRTFQIFAVYAYFQTLAIGLYNGPLVAEGGGSGGGGDSGGGSSGCCPFNIVIVNDATYSVDADGYNTMYVSNKPMADDNVIFSLPKSVEAGEGANFEFLVIGNYNPAVDGKFVLKTDAADTDGITWIGGSHTAINLVSDQSYSKIRMVADGVVGWYAESGEGLWGSATRDVFLHWPYTDKFLYTANVVDSVEDNITTFDEFGNIQDSGVSIGSVGGVTTASNYGIGGVGVYNDRNVNDLRFRNINVGSNKLTVVLDNANHEVDLDVDESNIEHQNLSGAGYYTHTVIDAHMDSYNNPHAVTQTQVGLSHVHNFRQVEGVASITPGDIVEWGVDGYHVADSGVAIDDLQPSLTFIDSVQEAAGNVNLVGDAASPSANNFYGMSRGVTPARGWHTRNIVQRVTVGQAGSDVDYNSIKEAVDYVTTQSPSALAQWEVIVYPGVYIEDPMAIIAGINVISHEQRINTVFVQAAHSNQDLFTMTGGYVCGLTAYGVTNASNCIFRAATPVFSVLHGVSFFNCSSGVIASGGAVVVMTNTSILISGPFQAITNAAITATGVGSYVAISGMFASVPAAIAAAYYPISNAIEKVVEVVRGGEIYISSGVIRVTSNGIINSDAIFADDSGKVLLCSVDISGCGNALHIGSVGTNSEIITQGANLQTNKNNIVNDSSTGKVFASHTSDVAGYTGLSGTQLSGVVQYQNDALVKFIGNVEYQYLVTGEDVAFDRFFSEYTSTGISVGGFVSEGSGLHVNVTEGYGWIRRGADSYDSFDVSWDPETALPIQNGTNYIVYNMTNGIERLASPPNYNVNILLATVYAETGNIRFLHRTRNFLTAPMEQMRDYLLATRKRMMNSGLLVSTDTTSHPIDSDTFDISGGSYYIGLDLIPSAVTPFSDMLTAEFTYFFDGGNQQTTVFHATTHTIDLTQFDSAGTLTTMAPTDGYRVDTVIITSDQRISVIYGTETYSTLLLAEAAPVGITPAKMEHTSFPLANLIVWGTHGIVEVIDLRSQEVGTGGGGGGVTVHNDLSGRDSLTAHTQYLLKTGGPTEAMAGDLYMGAQAIINAGLINGINIADHSSGHQPNSGVDPLACAAPEVLKVGDPSATSLEGSDNFFARSDHEHAVPTGTPVAIGTPAWAGDSKLFVHSNHVHTHGNQLLGDGLNHALANGTYAGFMSSTAYTNSHVPMTLASSATTGGMSVSGTDNQTIGFQVANGSQNGYLTSANYTLFFGKMTDPTTTIGDMIYRNASLPTAVDRLPAGTAGYVLRAAGAGVVPAWYLLEKIVQGNTSAEVIDAGADGRFIITTEGVERVRVNASGLSGFGTDLASGTTGRVTSQGTTTDNTTATFVGRNSSSTATFVTTSNGELRAGAVSIGNTAINTSPTSVGDFITDTSNWEKEIFIGPTTNSRGEGITIGQSVSATGNYMLIGKNIHGGTTTSNYRTVYGNGSAYGYLGIEFMPNGIMRFLASNATTVGGATITPSEFMQIDGGTNSSLMIGTTSYSGDVGGKVIVKVSGASNIFVGRDLNEYNVFTVNSVGALTLGRIGLVTNGKITLVQNAYSISLLPSASTQGSDLTFRLPNSYGSAGQFLRAADGAGALDWGTASGGVTAYDLSTGTNLSLSASGVGVLLTRNIQINLSSTSLSVGTNLSLSSGVSIVGSTPVTLSFSSTPTFTSTTLTSATTPLMFNNGGFTGTLFWTPASNWTLKLPASDGTSTYLMSTNGSGQLGWTNPGSFTVPLLTASNGVTRVANDFQNELIIGKAGGQTILGGTGFGDNLVLRTTSNATKGFVQFGAAGTTSSMWYNEANNRLGLANVVSGTGPLLCIGTSGTIAGTLSLSAGTSGGVGTSTVTLQVPNSSFASYTFEFPNSVGTTGYYLQKTASGTTWSVMAEADTLATVTGRGSYTGIKCAFNSNLSVGSTGVLPGTTTIGAIDFKGSLSGMVTIQTTASPSTWIMTLPQSGAGAANYVLKSVGTGAATTTTWGQVNVNELYTTLTSGDLLVVSGTGVSSVANTMSHDYGTGNVYVGINALHVQADGWNTAVGNSALLNTSSTYNTACGGAALSGALTGGHNIGIGVNAGKSITSGTYNIIIGAAAVGGSLLTGTGNVGIGTNVFNLLTSGNYNVAIGDNAGIKITGSYNVALGYTAQYNLSTGSSNVALGPYSLYNVTINSENVAIGQRSLVRVNSAGYAPSAAGNTAIGHNSGYSITTGINNVAVGYEALGDNTSATSCTGNYNIAIGSLSAIHISSGSDNIIIGRSAASALTTGSSNIAVGVDALDSNVSSGSCIAIGDGSLSRSTGALNIALGYSSGNRITSGTHNLALGYSAFSGISGSASGSYNIAIGEFTLSSLTSGSNLIAIGHNALTNMVSATYSIAIGDQSAYNMTAEHNVCVGYRAGYGITTGTNCIAIGQSALGKGAATWTTGSDNIAIGYQTLDSLTSGFNNVCIGTSAGTALVEADGNVIIGKDAANGATGGSRNVIAGLESAQHLLGVAASLTGSYNVIMGYRACSEVSTLNNSITSGIRNVAIGANTYIKTTTTGGIAIGSGAKVASEGATIPNYGIAIGYNSYAEGNGIGIGYGTVAGLNVIRLGNLSHTNYYVGGGPGPWVFSDMRLKSNINDIDVGLDFITKLRPVSYNVKKWSPDMEYMGDVSRKSFGFIAQEVSKVIDSNKYRIIDNPKINNPETKDYMCLSYQDLMAPMVKAIQEQQAMIESLKAEVELLKKKLS